jgi:hypothetical protein
LANKSTGDVVALTTQLSVWRSSCAKAIPLVTTIAATSSGTAARFIAILALRAAGDEPRLRRREARKTRNRGPEIDRFPLRVEAGSLQLFNPRKQIIDEAGDALKAVRFGRPVEGHQRRRYGNRGHALALLD